MKVSNFTLFTLFILPLTSFAAKSENFKPVSAMPLMQSVADLLNSQVGIVGVQIKEWKGLSAKDSAYLKSISYRLLLPKGSKAVATNNGVIVLQNKVAIATVVVRSLDPLILQTSQDNKIEVDPKNLIDSISKPVKVSGSSALSEAVNGMLSLSLIPTAFAVGTPVGDQETIELNKKIAFLMSVHTKYQGLKQLKKFKTESVKNILAMLDFDSVAVTCPDPKSYDGATLNFSKDGYVSLAKYSSMDPWAYLGGLERHEEDGGTFVRKSDRVGVDTLERMIEKDEAAEPAAKAGYLEELRTQVAGSGIVKDLTFTEGSCVPVFQKNAKLSNKDLGSLKAQVQKYCESRAFAVGDRLRDARRELAKISKLGSYYGKNTFMMRHLSYNLGMCCRDSNCRLGAKEVGIQLDSGDADSGSKDAK